MMRFVVEIPDGDMTEEFRKFETWTSGHFTIKKMYAEQVNERMVVCGENR
jgi:hypothetical protein